MDYKTFAKRFLEKVGAFEEGSNYDGMIGSAVMSLVQVFSKEGHSGASAHITAETFAALNHAYENRNDEIWQAYWKSPEGLALQAAAGTPGVMIGRVAK